MKRIIIPSQTILLLIPSMLISSTNLIDDMEFVEPWVQYDSKLQLNRIEAVDESDIMNPYKQPNDDLTISYGSGDVDQDGDLDLIDYNLIVGGIDNIWADIDGDGTPSDPEDAQLLLDFLEGNTSYLPGHWNNLLTPEGKISWVDNMLSIDQTNHLPYHDGSVDERWISGNYSTQIYLNFFGFDGDDIHQKYFENGYLTPGRYNLPIYAAIIYDPLTGMGHGMNMTLTGQDPTNIYDWVYIEPQSDGTIQIDDNMLDNPGMLGQRLYMFGGIEFNDHSSPDMLHSISLVAFDIDEVGSWSLYYQSPELILFPEEIPIILGFEEVSLIAGYKLGANFPNPFNPISSIKYSIPQKQKVLIEMYNLNGEIVKTLVNEIKYPGNYSVSIDGSDLPSGIYIYRMQSGEYNNSGKMTIIK